eukprot:TRINITY_DN10351_c0_g1_i1.p1 TRINITY_DN10351_c0_g1~~TRINITY_DN10351_c0_g1_i1.p1  ORF type:complete len:414 (-),score=44.04 TRINITY_DN10351_c0_g1_i1:9-1250(-)
MMMTPAHILFILAHVCIVFCATVNINIGDDFAKVLQANPAGTTFVVAASTFSFAPVVMKPGVSIIGQGASMTRLNGSITTASGCVMHKVLLTSSSKGCLSISGDTVTITQCEIGPCQGNAIAISGSNDVTIADSYIHPERKVAGCCDTGDGIFIQNGKNSLIQGNIIAYSETNVEMSGSTNITIKGNFLLNPLGPFPRGQQVQAWSKSSSISVLDNYAISSTDTSKYKYPAVQEDAINFGVTDGVTATGNWIMGGESKSGCGLIADDAANSVYFANNTLYMTGQCGIGIASGTNQRIVNNRVLNSHLPAGGNTAMYVWKQYNDAACGPTSVTGNILYGDKPDGTPSSYWNGGGCDPVTFSGNTLDAAAKDALSPIMTKYPPPVNIPPLPVDCTIRSPFSHAESGVNCYIYRNK